MKVTKKESARRYYLKNRDEILRKNEEWRIKNADKKNAGEKRRYKLKFMRDERD